MLTLTGGLLITRFSTPNTLPFGFKMTVLTVTTWIAIAVAYYFGSRQLSFLAWILAYGEKYPDDGIPSYQHWSETGTSDRAFLWVPVFGEFHFIIWVLASLFRGATRTVNFFGTMTAMEDALVNRLEARKLRKEFGPNHMQQLAMKDPEGMRKALEEIGRLKG
jgi:hypothetical protein